MCGSSGRRRKGEHQVAKPKNELDEGVDVSEEASFANAVENADTSIDNTDSESNLEPSDD